MSVSQDEYALLKHGLYSLSNQLSKYVIAQHNENVIYSMQEVKCAISGLLNDLKSQDLE